MRICVVSNDSLSAYKDLDRWIDRPRYYDSKGHDVAVFEPQNLESFDRFLEKWRPDVVRTLEGGRFVCSHVVGTIAKRHGVPFVPSIHGIDVECNKVRGYPPREAAYYTACRESVSEIADAIIATQWSYQDYFTEWGCGDKTVFIPNYAMPHFKPHRYKKRYDCIHVGRLCVDKDIKSLVLAVKAVQCSSVFIGVGPDARFVEESGAELVSGMPNAELPGWYSRSRICIVADPMTYTGFGIPIIEAQSCKIPVVFLAREEPEQHVEYFMEPSLRVNTIDAMVTTIKQLLSEESFYKSVANKALRRAKRNFNREKCLDAELALYEEVVKK